MMITLIILILIPFDVLLDRNKRRIPACSKLTIEKLEQICVLVSFLLTFNILHTLF